MLKEPEICYGPSRLGSRTRGMSARQPAAANATLRKVLEATRLDVTVPEDDLFCLSASLGPQIILEMWVLASFPQGRGGLGRSGGYAELATGHPAHKVRDVLNTLQPRARNQ